MSTKKQIKLALQSPSVMSQLDKLIEVRVQAALDAARSIASDPTPTIASPIPIATAAAAAATAAVFEAPQVMANPAVVAPASTPRNLDREDNLRPVIQSIEKILKDTDGCKINSYHGAADLWMAFGVLLDARVKWNPALSPLLTRQMVWAEVLNRADSRPHCPD